MDTKITTPFVHLRVHSAYSLAEGAIKIPEIIELCQKNQMNRVAITDTSNMFGALEFSLACAQEKIQALMGMEVKLHLSKEDNPFKLPPIVLLAQNEQGYKNLLKIISHAYEDLPSRQVPYVTMEDLRHHHEGLVVLSGGAEGPLGQLILDRKKDLAKKIMLDLQQIFQSRFYMEIGRHGQENELKTEDIFIDWAYEFNIPLVATNNVFFSDSSMHEAHDALLCIAEGTYVSEPNRRRVTPHHYFKSDAEMKALFADLPEAIANTYLIAQSCQFMPTSCKPVLPTFSTESGRSEEEELRVQAKEGLEKRLSLMPEPPSPELRQKYFDRLALELETIIKMGFPGYFLIVADFIQWAKKNNIPVGPGRGSGAGSVVSWSLTITDLDPIRFGLFFERFLNPERVSMPDFDVDFCQDRRDEVIQYVQKRYGKERVAHIITFGKLQARAVLRDVGRVLQIPYPQVDKISKLVPQNPANPCTLEEAIHQEPLLQEMIKTDPMVAKLANMGQKLEGLYRHASTHAAGLIIGDKPLEETVPLYRDAKSDILATQFSMKYVELAGLVKFDFLGLKTLTVLKKSVDMAISQGKEVNLSTIPLDDKKTFDLLNRVETVGIFQLEGQGMRDVVRRLRIDCFEEIITLGAIYRPGPMDDIPRYIACKHGDQEVHYAHPCMEPILKETYGVMVYQEQVMQIAQVFAGYTIGGADLLRRAMGKKIKSEMDAQRKIFIEGAIGKGINKGLATQVFDQIAKFASYAFPKAHAAPYGLVTYQTAYMKANFPHEFMAATMTYDKQNTDKLAIYKQELSLMGIQLLPPDVNQSQENFSVEINLITGEKSVRYALAAVKNVGEASMAALVAEREKNGTFKSLEDFLTRLTTKVLNKRQLESLINSGALDSLHPIRRNLFESVEVFLRYAGDVLSAQENTQAQLFGSTVFAKPALELPSTPEWSVLEKLKQESEALGFYLSSHPLESYGEKILKKLKVIKSDAIDKFEGVQTMLIGMPSFFKQRTSKTGRKFAFLGLSDDKGPYEVTVFAEQIARARDLVEVGDPLLISVSIRTDDQGLKRMTVTNLNSLEEAVKNIENKISVHLKSRDAIQTLKSFLDSKTGGRTKISLSLPASDFPGVVMELPHFYKITPTDLATLSAMEHVEVREEG
ncbi:MAG: DNA polymerase III subunit alpha [Alphaproteobacteria bacterium]